MRPGTRADLTPLLLLGAAAFVASGGVRGLLGLGFYLDDWALLSDIVFYRGDHLLLDSLKAHGARPLSFLAWTVPYFLFGLKTPLWHGLMAALQWALAAAAYFVFRGFSVDRAAAVLGAMVFLAFPNKDATTFWPAVSILNSTALLLFLGAWLARDRHAVAGVLLLASLCFYEQSFFLLPLWLLAPQADAKRLRRGLMICGGVLAAFALYKFVALPLLMPYTKPMRASPGHAVFVYYMALRATLDPRWWLYLARCAAAAVTAAPVLSAAAVALPWLAWRLVPRDAAAPGDGPRRLVWWGAGVWVLGYLPFCVTVYAPGAYDEMNRINQLPVLGLAAALCGLAAGRRAGRVALACLASFGLLVHVEFAEIWRESYRRQFAVKRAVLAQLPAWPREKGLIVRLPESHVAGKAPVFVTNYDVSGAIRLWTGDPLREAWSVTGQTVFDAEGATLYGERRSYDSLLLLDMTAGGRLTPLTHALARTLR